MPKEAIVKPSSRNCRQPRQVISLQASTEGILYGRLPRCKPLLLFKATSSHALDFMPKEKCYHLTAGDCKLFTP